MTCRTPNRSRATRPHQNAGQPTSVLDGGDLYSEDLSSPIGVRAGCNQDMSVDSAAAFADLLDQGIQTKNYGPAPAAGCRERRAERRGTRCDPHRPRRGRCCALSSWGRCCLLEEVALAGDLHVAILTNSGSWCCAFDANAPASVLRGTYEPRCGTV